jgi:hypothetical protein
VRRPGAALARGGLAPLSPATSSVELNRGPKRRRAAALQGEASTQSSDENTITYNPDY